MKKLLCLLLVLFLVPGTLIFSACGKDNGYKLSSMQSDLLAIADSYDSVVAEDNKLKFDYSCYKVGEKTVLADHIANTEPYTNVILYNQVFDNLMAFTFEYAGVCSSDSFNVDKNFRNGIKTKIDALSSSFDVIDVNLRSLAEIISEDNATHEIYVSRLNNVLKAYKKLYTAGTNLANAVADLYFNNILYNANPNISEIKLEEFNASVVISNLNARTKNALSLLTQNYIETYVSNENLLNTLLGDSFSRLDLTVNGYNSYVGKLTVVDLRTSENIERAIEVANHENNKSSFYEKAIEAYNEQEIVQNDRNSYLKACEDVDYLKTKADDKASSYEKICVTVIENYSYITNAYSASLGELLAIINV